MPAMKPKTLNILYWIVTILFAAMMLMAGIVEAIQHESGKEIMTHLGYPFPRFNRSWCW